MDKKKNQDVTRAARITGWVAVIISTAISGFWAFWGAIENFHEGWYYASLTQNLQLMFFQYLSPMLLFIGLAVASIVLPRIGFAAHCLAAIFAMWFFRGSSNFVQFLIAVPLTGLGILYLFGRPKPSRWAILVAVGLPLLIMIGFGIEPVIRVSQRLDDGNLGLQRVAGQEVDLFWAPAGPGWPDAGNDWFQATHNCQYLGEDGETIQQFPQGIWRLPTADEVVSSMTFQDENAGGDWDPDAGKASYAHKPDKEPPLWNIYSRVIYWWTATELNADQALMIVYDGNTWVRSKDFETGNIGYRCVRNPGSD